MFRWYRPNYLTIFFNNDNFSIIFEKNCQNKMHIYEFFYKHPIFTHQEFNKYLNSQGQTHHVAQYALLRYHLKQGHIAQLRRELYAVIPPGSNPKSFAVDMYLLTSKLTVDAILGYHTALELHGLAYSLFEHFTYITSHNLRPFAFRNHLFRSISTPASLLRKHKEDYGVIKINREGVEIRITSLARTLVDVLARPNLVGGWEEVWRSLETLAVFNVEEAIEYVELLDNNTTAAKLGYFLEQLPSALAVDKKYIQQLQKRRPAKPHYLDRSQRHSGRYIAKWNLMIPIEIAEKTWEEPYEDI